MMSLDAVHQLLEQIRLESTPGRKVDRLKTAICNNPQADILRRILDPKDPIKRLARVSDKTLLAILGPCEALDAYLAITVLPAGSASSSIEELWAVIMKLAATHGPKSHQQKTQLLATYLRRCTISARAVIVQTLCGRFRCGMSIALLKKAFELTDAPLAAVIDHLEDPKYRFKPMLCRTHHPTVLPYAAAKESHVYEYKYDGFRVIYLHHEGRVVAYTRNLKDLPALAKWLRTRLGHGDQTVVVDMELTADSFQQVSTVIMRKQLPAIDLTVHLFDALWLGKCLIQEPYLVRKAALRQWCDRLALDVYTPYYALPETQAQLLDGALASNYQGVILKDKMALYTPGERKAWVKLKPVFHQADLLVLKRIVGKGHRQACGSVLVGAKSGSHVVEVAQVGSGFKEADLKTLLDTDDKEPLVIQVHYQGVQRSSKYAGGISLRFPVFKRFRFDKGVSDLTELTNL